MVLCLSIEDDWTGEPLLLRCSQLLLDRLCHNKLVLDQICLIYVGFRSHNYSQGSRGTREKSRIWKTLNLLTCVNSSSNKANPLRKKKLVVSCQVSHFMCSVSPITCDMSITPTAKATERWDNLSIFQGQSNIRTVPSVATNQPTNTLTNGQSRKYRASPGFF